MARIPDDLINKLKDAARAAAGKAYAPYSHFRVGAACLTGSGRIHAGANVENASYGISICAERVAVFRAISEGEQDIRALAVFTPTAEPVTPCGACRQVLCEFGEATEVTCFCDGPRVVTFLSGSLLPERFKL